jgi:hypothetical protein
LLPAWEVTGEVGGRLTPDGETAMGLTPIGQSIQFKGILPSIERRAAFSLPEF